MPRIPAVRGLIAKLFVGLMFVTVSATAAQAQRASSDDASRCALSSAYPQFVKFLDLSVASRAPARGYLDSVYMSDMFDDLVETRWLAASRILGIHVESDSEVTATALITTVARQREVAEGEYDVRFQIRSDTARWTMLCTPASTLRWKVSGESHAHYGVEPLGRVVRWKVGNQARAIAAIDSIRRARGLPIVR